MPRTEQRRDIAMVIMPAGKPGPFRFSGCRMELKPTGPDSFVGNSQSPKPHPRTVFFRHIPRQSRPMGAKARTAFPTRRVSLVKFLSSAASLTPIVWKLLLRPSQVIKFTGFCEPRLFPPRYSPYPCGTNRPLSPISASLIHAVKTRFSMQAQTKPIANPDWAEISDRAVGGLKKPTSKKAAPRQFPVPCRYPFWPRYFFLVRMKKMSGLPVPRFRARVSRRTSQLKPSVRTLPSIMATL